MRVFLLRILLLTIVLVSYTITLTGKKTSIKTKNLNKNKIYDKTKTYYDDCGRPVTENVNVVKVATEEVEKTSKGNGIDSHPRMVYPTKNIPDGRYNPRQVNNLRKVYYPEDNLEYRYQQQPNYSYYPYDNRGYYEYDRYGNRIARDDGVYYVPQGSRVAYYSPQEDCYDKRDLYLDNVKRIRPYPEKVCTCGCGDGSCECGGKKCDEGKTVEYKKKSFAVSCKPPEKFITEDKKPLEEHK